MNFNPGYTWKKELSLWWAEAAPYCNSNTGSSIHQNKYLGQALAILSAYLLTCLDL
jgi:hypothetical protein